MDPRRRGKNIALLTISVLLYTIKTCRGADWWCLQVVSHNQKEFYLNYVLIPVKSPRYWTDCCCRNILDQVNAFGMLWILMPSRHSEDLWFCTHCDTFYSNPVSLLKVLRSDQCKYDTLGYFLCLNKLPRRIDEIKRQNFMSGWNFFSIGRGSGRGWNSIKQTSWILQQPFELVWYAFSVAQWTTFKRTESFETNVAFWHSRAIKMTYRLKFKTLHSGTWKSRTGSRFRDLRLMMVSLTTAGDECNTCFAGFTRSGAARGEVDSNTVHRPERRQSEKYVQSVFIYWFLRNFSPEVISLLCWAEF